VVNHQQQAMPYVSFAQQFRHGFLFKIAFELFGQN
jgi:hypothetical protein